VVPSTVEEEMPPGPPTELPSPPVIEQSASTNRTAEVVTNELTITKLNDNYKYRIEWPVTSSVTIIRGDLSWTTSSFTETVVYRGTTSHYVDTQASVNTKYYRLESSEGEMKTDINTEDLYNYVTTNANKLTYDDIIVRYGVRYAPCGDAGIIEWKSNSPYAKVKLDSFGGKTQSFIITNDPDSYTNYYIINDIHGLISITVYDVNKSHFSNELFILRLSEGGNMNEVVAGLQEIVNSGVISDAVGEAMGGGGCFISQ
jgi:hypothetical protein